MAKIISLEKEEITVGELIEKLCEYPNETIIKIADPVYWNKKVVLIDLV